jgi:hypothetical protein
VAKRFQNVSRIGASNSAVTITAVLGERSGLKTSSQIFLYRPIGRQGAPAPY